MAQRYYLTTRATDGSWETTDRVSHYDRDVAEFLAAEYNRSHPGYEQVLTLVPPDHLEPMSWQVEELDGVWRLVYRNAAIRRGVSDIRLKTRKEAERALVGHLYIIEHTDALPTVLTREDYERRCAAAGLEPASDDAIIEQAYALRYGVFSLADDLSGRLVVDIRLRAARLWGIRASQAIETRRAVAARPTFVCAGCGGTYPATMAMAASLGITCPDCYDDLAG